MNSGPTSERVYAALKRLILDRRFRPGERLDPARIGEELNSSVTPVRDALHILVGEGLVETRTGEGFQLPPIDEPGLQDLYAWNAQLLTLAIRTWPAHGRCKDAATLEPDEGAAGRAARLFTAIADRSPNAEHRVAIDRLNDRLHAARLVEAQRLDGTDDECAALEAALGRGDVAALRKLVLAYHRRRQRTAGDIVRALYRGTRAGPEQPFANNRDVRPV